MNILITNDDGIHSPGLFALKQALDKVGQVYIVAPDRPRSACGHSITLHKPLRATAVQLPDGTMAFASNGTPSDCVSLGLLGLLDVRIDLVVSGINHGPNLGWDLTYSGTVSAAMEGVIAGVQSFAISVASHEADVEYGTTAIVAAQIADILNKHRLPESTLLNVNVPAVLPQQINGIQITRQGKRRYQGALDKRSDPMGRDYYWIGGDMPVDHLEEGTDVKAISENKVSITPIHLDLTDHMALDMIHAWGMQDIAIPSESGLTHG